MARQVLPFVGLVVGSFFGAPQLGFAIGSIVGNIVDPQVIKGPKIGEAPLQTSAEGVFRPVVFGTCALKGNVIDRGNRQVKKKRTQQGKGGPVIEEERVYWTFAIRLAEGPIAGLLRIWQDEKLVYDVRPGSSIVEESQDFAERFRLYLGDEDQLPDPDIEAYTGIGNTPAYRGTAYVVFPNMDLTDFRERIPDFRFEVTTSITTSAHDTMAIGTTGVLTFRTVVSPDGQDWDEPPQPISIGFNRLLALDGNRFLSYSPTDAQYSDDFGATWNSSTGGLGGSGGGRVGATLGDVILIPGGAAGAFGMYRSVNRGQTFVGVPGAPSLGAVTIKEDRAIAVANSTSAALYVWYSIDSGLTWEQGAAGDGFALASDFCIDNDGGVCIIGSDKDGNPHLWVTATGEGDLVEHPLIGGTATRVTAICADAGDRWLAGTDTGDIWWSSNGGDNWNLSDDSFGGGVNAITHNGERFIIVGGFTPAIIATTETGETLEFETHPFNQSITDVASQRDLIVSVGSGVSLASYVAAMHERAGQDSTFYDVSGLDQMLDGIVLSGDYTCADAIRTLMPTFFYDAAEYDNGTGYRVRYLKRGRPVVDTITEDDLIDAPEKTIREDALERPKTLHLHFESPTVGYVPAKATVTRDSPDVLVVGELSWQVPVAFNDPEVPRRIAHQLHKVAWVEVAGEEDFTLPDNWLELVPSDCIGVSIRGQVRRMRVVQELIDGGSQRYRLIADRQSAYTSNITGIPLPPVTPPLPSIVGATIFEFLDIPALTDNNDRLLYYVAASGQTEAWYGAVVQRAVPPDPTWTDATTFTLNSVMGVLENTVSTASEHYTDTTNVVEVTLYMDEVLNSLTQQQFLSEGGSFALEKPDGTWEIMQYRDAEEQSDGSFALSYLARGRLNSGTSVHNPGARFVLLNGVRSVDAQTAWLNGDLNHRAISFENSPDGATVYTDAYVGKSQTEFPVAHLFLDRDTNTINAEAIPRHRFGTELTPIRSINWQGFMWTATDGVNSTSRTTIEQTTAFDVTGWSSPVTVTVSQVNRFTGAGPSVTEEIA